MEMGMMILFMVQIVLREPLYQEDLYVFKVNWTSFMIS